MKHKSKLFGLLAIITMLVPLFVGGIVGGAAEATGTADNEPDTINMVLHKKEFDKMPEILKENTGELMNNFGGKGLNGAGFTVFNITDFVYGLIENKVVADAAAAIAKAQEVAAGIEKGSSTTIGAKAYENFTDMGAKAKAEVTTAKDGEDGEDGIAKFNDLAYKTNDKHSVYMFIETTIPDNVSTHAAPLIVSLPLTNSAGKYLTTAHLYPKDVTFTDGKHLDTDGLTKVDLTDADETNHIYGTEVGKVHDFTINFTIPAKIKDKTSYGFTDTPSKGLELVVPTEGINSAVTITSSTDEKLTAGTHYTITPNTDDGGFTVDFKVDQAVVQALAGKSFTASYKMVVTDEAEEYQEFGNKATVKVGDKNYPYETPKLIYGGHTFVKQDQNTKAKLAGAKFVITKRGEDTTKALKFTKKDGKYVLAANGATELETDANGLINVEGLDYGEYDLHETAAPNEYIKLDAPVQFTIAPNTAEGATTLIPSKTIDNVKKGLLPSTGGTGIIAFLAVGAALMAGAFIWYRKSKVNEEV
ncbi:SpaH/EbpB family LPXTG-anchored major pilin [Enterococcus sp. SMC-9]|uniref:SpaH/EbpB family LPXTG-anchored major pilin n=1 Tax=Enterococcus sp. SMC-9 TaxID=2862343 RepID=UPI001E2A534B|nr:SpaH/EbpB family LPXTG-anchored major pilin [Enterococcus sp. SMC-9]MCD1025771.1 SpaH/EbpB family LPXTG-anchored major pilin [Enterococcus sp. SMC-9]